MQSLLLLTSLFSQLFRPITDSAREVVRTVSSVCLCVRRIIGCVLRLSMKFHVW